MRGELIGVAIIQCRASDGRKVSWTEHDSKEKGDAAVKQYRRFMNSVRPYPHHRRRFCYRVNVYAKGE